MDAFGSPSRGVAALPLLPTVPCKPRGPGQRCGLPWRGAEAPRCVLIAAKLVSLVLLAPLLYLATFSPDTASVASPVSLSAIDAPQGASSWQRWLWWPIILYLFWGMAYVCDEYFVRTIDIISERFSIPEDVAGATLMALGCNGPELALNTISIVKQSNIGVGAVIGGEVFNVLVIIGTALLATPSCYMPLKLGKFTFGRDVCFYALSVALLWLTLRDGKVTRCESSLLLAGALLYVLAVTLSDKVQATFKTYTRQNTLLRQTTLFHRQLTRYIRMNTPVLWLSEKGVDIDDSSSDSSEEDVEMTSLWEQGLTCADPQQGSVLGVRVDMRNRLMDRTHHYDDRYMCIGEDSLLLSTAKDPRQHHMNYAGHGMVYDYHDHQWHHGGLVNEPTCVEAARVGGTQEAVLPTHQAKFLNTSQFGKLAVEVIALEDILYVERPRDHSGFTLHVQHRSSGLAGVVDGHPITLEFRAKTVADEARVIDAWYEALMVKMIDLRRSSYGPPPRMTFFQGLMQWVEWWQFPVKFWLSVTVPNMDQPDKQHLYPVSFVMCMVWLALFAFSVIAACDGIHATFGISTKILGFTVAAAGTSCPNVFSGMAVARQGKTTMAVANALGANVQNVFLALALPWAIQTWVVHQGSFELEVGELTMPILWCYITLLPVVAVYLLCSCSLPRWSGFFFLAVYAIYMVFVLGAETSHCAVWPLQC